MKQLISFLIACILVLSFSAVAFASDDAVSAREKDSLLRDSSAGYTVKDSNNNRYYILGWVSRSGHSASVYTGFSVTYYNGGTPADQQIVDGYGKYLTATADVYLAGGGSNTLGRSRTLYGANNALSDSEDDYIYTVIGVYGMHVFSCNGAYKAWYTDF